MSVDEIDTVLYAYSSFQKFTEILSVVIRYF